MMESQFTHRIEMMLVEERVCLERHKEELAVRQARVLYLESITSEVAAFQERTNWRKNLPSLPRWPSRRKANKRKPRGTARRTWSVLSIVETFILFHYVEDNI